MGFILRRRSVTLGLAVLAPTWLASGCTGAPSIAERRVLSGLADMLVGRVADTHSTALAAAAALTLATGSLGAAAPEPRGAR